MRQRARPSTGKRAAPKKRSPRRPPVTMEMVEFHLYVGKFPIEGYSWGEHCYVLRVDDRLHFSDNLDENLLGALDDDTQGEYIVGVRTLARIVESLRAKSNDVQRDGHGGSFSCSDELVTFSAPCGAMRRVKLATLELIAQEFC